MSMSRSEGHGDSAAGVSQTDRRDQTAPRLQFEALVEVGGNSAGGFEAESLDVSLDGMRLRTAYLPTLGETLVCRFDGFGGEIVAEGQVAWCRQEARGGEFGIRFTSLDPRAFRLLQNLCEPYEDDEPVEEEPSQPDGARPGSRVRLHIQGLGSPMRARVRDAAGGEVLIGSNLEFLRVGRDVELEDVEAGGKRIAMIEHVAVDVDPETNIPQLVVALAYEGAEVEAGAGAEAEAEVADPQIEVHDDLTTAPYRVRAAAAQQIEQQQESTPEPTVIDNEPELTPSPGRQAMHAPDNLAAEMMPEGVAATDEDEPEPEPVEDEELDKSNPSIPMNFGPAGAAKRSVEHVGVLARKLAPKIASAGAGAKGAFGKMITNMRQRRAEMREERAKRQPRRKTAPPPSGALKSDGKRLFRDKQQQPAEPVESVAEPPPKAPSRKRAVFGAVLGVMAVIAIYFASSHFSDKQQAATSDPASADQGTPAAAAQPVGNPGSIATAQVPLFGATPLSTTEAVPPPGGAAAAGVPASEQSGEDKSAAKPANLEKEWGVGEVTNPTVLRLKMDGKIDGLLGTETATGFTITVPSRKSISSAAGLAMKDKRIESVNVINFPDRAEVTFHFKKDVPAFVAKTSGKRLIIEIATKSKKKKKSSKKKSKKKSSKKKTTNKKKKKK